MGLRARSFLVWWTPPESTLVCFLIPRVETHAGFMPAILYLKTEPRMIARVLTGVASDTSSAVLFMLRIARRAS